MELIIQNSVSHVSRDEALQKLSVSDPIKDRIYLLDSESDLSEKFRIHIPYHSRSSAPIPTSVLDYQTSQISSLGLHPSREDISAMLHYGRSSFLTGERFDCRLSFSPDIFGRVFLCLHRPVLQSNIPADMIRILETGHLGHTILHPDSISGLPVPSFVSYDSYIREPVFLPCSRMFFPMKLHGIPISFRQRKQLSQGRPLYLPGNITAQVDAVSASILFTKK